MDTYEDKSQQSTTESANGEQMAQERQLSSPPAPVVPDQRSIAVAQRKLQELATNSLQVQQGKEIHQMANQPPATEGRQVAQFSSAPIQRLNSASLALAEHGTVAKAPNQIGADRFSDSGNSIHQLNFDNFPGKAGSIVDGSDAGARVDLQGKFESDGKRWTNVQVQANETSGGKNYTDLKYPNGTSKDQKGTSFAEVHVDERIVDSDQEDVKNRGIRLLKQGLMESRGERTTYPRTSYRLTYD